MKIETDLKRVKELAAQQEDENWKFRRFLKGSDLTVEELDSIVHGHYDDISSQIDCTACGNCCKIVLPLLSPEDITRLAGALDTSNEQVIAEYLEPAEEDPRLTFKTTPCPLLSEKKCSVYEGRPDDCRSYPHLQKDEFVFRLIGVVHNISVCPIVFNVFERLKEELWRGRRRR